MVAVSQQVLHSAIFEGTVRHRRFSPKRNWFRYRVSMMYLDLDELPSVFKLTPLFSMRRWALVRFKRGDYLEGADCLKTAVLDTVEAELGFRPDGPVRLLTNLRYFGFIINPISVYYCFDQQQQLVAMVAHVTNEPWSKRIAYVLPTTPQKTHHKLAFSKLLHVSPFMTMDMHYHWYSNTPTEHLALHLSNRQAGKTVFDATLILKRQALSAQALNRNFRQFPVMTLKVVAAIYWQALKLLIKRVPLQPYPKQPAPASAAPITDRSST